MSYRNTWISALCALAMLCTVDLASAQTQVLGDSRKHGTSVQPHDRAVPEGNVRHNGSTRGHVNPSTGERGTRTPTPVPPAWFTDPVAPMGKTTTPTWLRP